MSAFVQLNQQLFPRFGGDASLAPDLPWQMAWSADQRDNFESLLLYVEADSVPELPRSQYGFALVPGSADNPEPLWDYQILGHARVGGSRTDDLTRVFVETTVEEELLVRGESGAWEAAPDQPGEPSEREVHEAFFDAIEHVARTEGRREIEVETLAIGAPPGVDALRPASGNGAILVGAEERYLLERGYGLEQIEQSSTLQLPAGAADQLGREAKQKAQPHYDLLTWVNHAPEEWLPGFLSVFNVFNVEAPSSGFANEETHVSPNQWRVREKSALKAGQTRIVTIAVRRETGEVAGLSNVTLKESDPHSAGQGLTLVTKAHRGHRLGMWMKTHMLKYLEQNHPAVTGITTWNASENAHMLGINTALGFQPGMVGGTWQKEISL